MSILRTAVCSSSHCNDIGENACDRVGTIKLEVYLCQLKELEYIALDFRWFDSA